MGGGAELMSSVDKRIVDMVFNNDKFEEGVAQSLSTIERLKDALNIEGAMKGFDALDNLALGGITDDATESVDRTAVAFSNLQVVGYTALSELTKGAMQLGGKILGYLAGPLEQAQTGGKKRALNLEQARFQMQGLGLDVDKAMGNALESVDGTAYGLDEAAKAAGQLAASGVELGGPMLNSLKGIAGVAAMTGSEYENVAGIFTKVAGNGRMMGMELNQLSSYGLNAAAVIGKYLGKTEAEVREMTTKGKISFEIFSNAMSDAFGEQATKANETYIGSLSNVKAALNRVGANFYTPYLENMRQVFNALRPVINNFNAGLKPLFDITTALMNFARAKTVKMLESIDLSRMQDTLFRILIPLSQIVKILYSGASKALHIFGDALDAVLPDLSPEPLIKFLYWFRDLISNIEFSEETMDLFHRTFAGLSILFDLLAKGIKALIGGIVKIAGLALHALGPLSTFILTVTANLGDLIVAIKDWADKASPSLKMLSDSIEKAGGILRAFGGRQFNKVYKGFNDFLKKMNIDLTGFNEFADSIAVSLAKSIDKLTPKVVAIADDFGGFLTKKFKEALKKWAPQFKDFGESIKDYFAEGLDAAIQKTKIKVKEFADVIKNAFLDVFDKQGQKIRGSFKGLRENFQNGIAALDVRPLVAFAGEVDGAFEPITKTSADGAGKKVKTVFERFRDAFTSVDWAGIGENIHDGLAKTFEVLGKVFGWVVPLFKKAGAVITTVFHDIGKAFEGVNVLDVVNTGFFAGLVIIIGKFLKPIRNLTESVNDVLGSVKETLEKYQQDLNADILFKIAASIALLGVALILIAAIPKEKLISSLVAVSVLLVELTGALLLLTHFMGDKQVETASASLIMLSVSLMILAKAVAILGKLNPQQVAVGVAAISVLLWELVAISAILAKHRIEMLKGSTSLMMFSFSLYILAAAVKKLGSLDYNTLIKGLGSMAAMFAMLGIFMNATKEAMQSTVSFAAGILLLSIAMIALATAFLILSKVPIEDIALGLGIMASTLLIVSLAVRVMDKEAASMARVGGGILLLAIALGLLIAPLVILANIPTEIIVRGLAIIGAMLGMLVAVVGLMGPVEGNLLATAAGLTMLAVAINLLIAPLAILGAMPYQVVLVGLAALAATFLVLGVAAYALTPMLPGIILLAGAMVLIGIGCAAAGFGLGVLATSMAAMGLSLAAFMAALVPFIDAMTNLAVQLVRSLTTVGLELVKSFVAIGSAFVKGVIQIVKNSLPALFSLIDQFITNLVRLIVNKTPFLVDAACNIITMILNGIASHLPDMIQAAFNLAIGFLNGLTDAINKNHSTVSEAVRNLIKAIITGSLEDFDASIKDFQKVGRDVINGLINGVKEKIGALKEACKGVGGKILDVVKKALGVNSPSREMMKIGRFVDLGLVKGINEYSTKVVGASAGVGDSAVATMQKSMSGLANLADANIDMNPTIRPVIDMSDVEDGITSTFDKQQSITLAASRIKAERVSGAVSQNESKPQQIINNNTTENHYNTTVNNPKPEPASGSVRTTLLKQSYCIA